MGGDLSTALNTNPSHLVACLLLDCSLPVKVKGSKTPHFSQNLFTVIVLIVSMYFIMFVLYCVDTFYVLGGPILVEFPYYDVSGVVD